MTSGPNDLNLPQFEIWNYTDVSYLCSRTGSEWYFPRKRDDKHTPHCASPRSSVTLADTWWYLSKAPPIQFVQGPHATQEVLQSGFLSWNVPPLRFPYSCPFLLRLLNPISWSKNSTVQYLISHPLLYFSILLVSISSASCTYLETGYRDSGALKRLLGWSPSLVNAFLAFIFIISVIGVCFRSPSMSLFVAYQGALTAHLC